MYTARHPSSYNLKFRLAMFYLNGVILIRRYNWNMTVNESYLEKIKCGKLCDVWEAQTDR